MSAILLTVLPAFAALVVDAGVLMVDRGQLQCAADSGALAAAAALGNGTSAATSEAKRFAELNYAGGSAVVVIAGQDVELGSWDSDRKVFTVWNGSSSSPLNAVRVTCRMAASRGN